MAESNSDATTVADLDSKFSELGQKWLSYEESFPKGDARAERARELRSSIQAWRKDLDSLNVIWGRWRGNCKIAHDLYQEASGGNLKSAQQREQLRELKKQLDADISSFNYFAETLLDHIAESVGVLLDDQDLNTQERLRIRGIVPQHLQQPASRLKERVARYRKEQTDEHAHFDPDGGPDQAAGLTRPALPVNSPDLDSARKLLQTYASGMMEFLDTRLEEPVPRGKQAEAVFPAQKSRSLMLGLGFVAVVAVLVLVVPSWTCLPSIFDDLRDSGELDPPLPGNCLFTSEEPSADTLHALEKRREERGLDLQKVVTCKMLGRPHDPRWLDNFYSDKSLQYGRHVFIAETQTVPGGTLFAVEACLVPRWRYLKRLAGRCEAEL
jgi:hypothetical protein